MAGKPLLTTVTGPTGCQTGYRYDATPLLTQVIDPNGYVTSYSYSGGKVSARQIVGIALRPIPTAAA